MRVLVAAATKHGSTMEIAERIAARLGRAGHATVALEAGKVMSLDEFDAVVLGSAVYGGRWLEDARQLVGTSTSKLRARPVWLFSSGPVVTGRPVPASDLVDVDAMLEQSGARGHRVFGGRIQLELLGFIERSMMRALRVESGDYRDWDEVEAWADEIAEALSRVDAAGAKSVAA
ncbi:MAG: flavodoxin domain-containing protein [Solirubrobacteraceae bacterium]|nr:flavodoxin domain-containing protein [Solirubrobacteraceae bacterium]